MLPHRRVLLILTLLSAGAVVLACSKSADGATAPPSLLPIDVNAPPRDPAPMVIIASAATEAGPPAALTAGPGAPACDPFPIGELCVRAASHPTSHVFSGGGRDEELHDGDDIVAFSSPIGCHSSSFTASAPIRAQRIDGASWSLQGQFCFARRLATPGVTLPDCGHHEARTPLGKLTAGTYTLKGGALQLAFTVPSRIPAGGLCVGRRIN